MKQLTNYLANYLSNFRNKMLFNFFLYDFRQNKCSKHPQLIVRSIAGPDNAYKIFQQLNALSKTKMLRDVNILVNDTVFPCHRNVLASACDYFKAMFTSNFEEQKMPTYLKKS